MSLVEEMRKAYRLGGDTYSSMEILGMLNRAANEIEKLTAQVDIARTALLTIKRHCEEAALKSRAR
jgi:hypothetical protein